MIRHSRDLVQCEQTWRTKISLETGQNRITLEGTLPPTKTKTRKEKYREKAQVGAIFLYRVFLFKSLGRKQCTGQGYNTTLTVIGFCSHPRFSRRANGILFSSILNFTTYVKCLIHECFVCNSTWKRQLSIELLWDRNTRSRVRGSFLTKIFVFSHRTEKEERKQTESNQLTHAWRSYKQL